MTQEDYIQKYYAFAIEQMNDYQIPASITLAQGILESGNGNSKLAVNANNHFGIKCHKGWKGKEYYMDDDEKDECFRVYYSAIESYVDHSLFLSKRGRYSFLFTDFATADYKKWAHGLKKAGYATNPKYPQLLIGIIEKHHLYKYDRLDFVPEEKPPKENQEDILAMEVVEDKEFELEFTDEYIKALMGRNVYYSDKEKGIFIYNRIKTIKSKNRTPLEIAVEYDVNYALLLKYNDINAEDFFKEDQNVFLQPKRFQASKKNYLVKPGDSMWEISQMFGIKLNQLYKKNLMNIGEQAAPGETLYLKKKRKSKINTIKYSEVLSTKKKLQKKETKKEVKETLVKPQETTININIFDKTDNKKVTIEKPLNIETEKEEVKEIYSPEKYIDKNEEMIKVINSIPVEQKEKQQETTVIGNNKTIIHKVEQGETLYFLSKKFNVSVDDLKKWNNLMNNNIDIGQELIISQ